MAENYGSNGSHGQTDPMDVPQELRDDFPVARSVDHLLVNNVRNAGMNRVQSANTLRRPFLYSNRSRTSSITSDAASNAVSDAHRHHNMAIRYRLFNRLDPGGQTLRMPDHVSFLSEWFSILPFDDFKDNEGKQSSLVTIFSIWNTMMGTSLLAMPWALAQAGLGLGVVLMALMAFLALYTAYRVVQSPQGITLEVETSAAEFSDVCRYYWGKKGEYTAVFFSIIVLFGGIIVYFVLMSNFLYFTGNIIYESLQPNSTVLPVLANKTFTCDIYYDEKCLPPKDMFDYEEEDESDDGFWSFKKLWSLQGTVPIYLGILTFPLLNFQSPTIFTKFNVLGTISVAYLIAFTMSKAYECGLNVNFSDATSIHYVELYNSKFTALTGTLALSYFIHNAVLTILRNQKHPENNARDLSIGYILAMICYIVIGCMFYLAFPGRRECISDNFLNNFGSGDVLSATARMFLLFQMITVLPLLMYLVRVQFSYVFTGTVYPGLLYVCLINVLVILVAVFFCIVYPHVGGILRYVGSLSGLVYIFALPSLVHLKKLQNSGKLTNAQIVIHSIIILLGMAFRSHRLISRLFGLRQCSQDAGNSMYVRKVKMMDYWNQSEDALETEFTDSQSIVLVDKEALVKKDENTNALSIVKFETKDLKEKLNQYGLEIGLLNSALIDCSIPDEVHRDFRPLFGCAVRTMKPPVESGIKAEELKEELAASLGGKFMNLRIAMLTLDSEADRHNLAKFQAVTRWYHTYRRCPTCSTPLQLRPSKSAARCIRCDRFFYPTISPVAITLVEDYNSEKVLLVRHKGSVSSVYTLIAGFAMAGESIQETAKREIAEEVGIEATDLCLFNDSQPWPMPFNSLMCGLKAKANPDHELDICRDELDAAGWFRREQVLEALERVEKDPFLKVPLSKRLENPDDFSYLPPRGAIAHRIIKDWALN
ncbi:unnamed protein product [Bursaphelenchus okinawaensis]|uniref:NAD(+) diphosphatase n=1 Tax=Bursaphelenchus okinawaensis TaxID=465554 RepID=A0A811L0V5_9BILA|nr:unnamed protein product [Bursaphelenchus okinawaensis]CAG9115479.1 unnamed protein product [Bursaphelenchus okinawaensis]